VVAAGEEESGSPVGSGRSSRYLFDMELMLGRGGTVVRVGCRGCAGKSVVGSNCWMNG
jgi:hypothetical protein